MPKFNVTNIFTRLKGHTQTTTIVLVSMLEICSVAPKLVDYVCVGHNWHPNRGHLQQHAIFVSSQYCNILNRISVCWFGCPEFYDVWCVAVLRSSFVDGVFANGWRRPKVQSFECRPVQLFRFRFADVEINAWKWLSQIQHCKFIWQNVNWSCFFMFTLHDISNKKRNILRNVLQGCMKSAYHGRFDRLGLCGSSMHSECDWLELICQNKMFWNLVSIFFHKCAVSWSSEPLKTSLLSDQYMVIRQHNLLMTMITHIIIRILMNQSVWLDRIVVFFMTQVDLAIGDSDEETGTPHVYSSISLGSQICKLVCVIWCHMVKWLYVSFQTLKQQMWMGQNYATPERVGPLLPQIWGREDQKPSLIDVTIDARWW